MIESSLIDAARYPRLSRIDTPADLRQFDASELPAIAAELRAYLIESVGRSGGHFGAGLGVIELTVALHYLYDTPEDRIVWDVGHQGVATRSTRSSIGTASRHSPSARKARTTRSASVIPRHRFPPRWAWRSPTRARATDAMSWR